MAVTVLLGQNAEGWTALHDATVHGKIEAVRRLLSAGADVSLKTAEGDTALHKAGRWNQREIVVLLLGRGADPNAADLVGNPPIGRSLGPMASSLLLCVYNGSAASLQGKTFF